MEKTIINYNTFNQAVINIHSRIFDGNYDLFKTDHIKNGHGDKVIFTVNPNVNLLENYINLLLGQNNNFLKYILFYFTVKGKPINPKIPNLKNVLVDKVLHELDNRLYTKKYLVNWVLYNLVKKQEKFIEDNLSFYQQNTITLENFKTRLDSLVDVFEPTGNLAIYFNPKIDLTELNEFYQNINYTKDTNLSLVTEKHATFNSEYEEILRKIIDQIDYHFYDDIKSVNLNFNETGVPYLTPLNNVPINRVNNVGILDAHVDYTYNRLPNKPSLKRQLKLMTKYPTVIKEVKDGLAKFDLPGITNLKLSDLTYTDFIETIIVNFVNYLVVYVVSQYEHTTSIIDIEMKINKSISLKVSINLEPINDTSNLKLLDKSGKYQFKVSELKLFY